MTIQRMYFLKCTYLYLRVRNIKKKSLNFTAQHSYPKELYMTARSTVSTLEPLLFSSQGSNAYLGNRDYVWIIRAEERWTIVTLEVSNTLLHKI